MKLKQFALRALIVLAIVIALCMFFSGTVRTITTPKVKIVTTKEGKLEQTAELNAKLTFPESEPFRMEEAMEVTLLVERVFVREGYSVKEGDLIFTATITDFDEKKAEIQNKYEEKAEELATLERKNSERAQSTTRTRQYNALMEAQEEMHQADLALSVLMRIEGVELDEQIPEGENELPYLLAQANGQDASNEILEAIRTRYRAKLAVQEVQEAFKESGKDWKLATTDETWEYITKRDALLEEMDELDEQLIELELMKIHLSEIRAPRDGYITAVSVKQGENYDGKAAAYEMNGEGVAPVLRADVSEVSLSVSEGATVTIGSGWSAVETTVSGVGFDSEGKKYADIALTDEVIAYKGGVYAMTQAETQATISTRAERATTLIPASAVRSEGEDSNYVYEIAYKYGTFTGDSMYVVKTPVTVIARSDKLVSVEEDMYGTRLADKEDRAISDGVTVMEYVN